MSLKHLGHPIHKFSYVPLCGDVWCAITADYRLMSAILYLSSKCPSVCFDMSDFYLSVSVFIAECNCLNVFVIASIYQLCTDRLVLFNKILVNCHYLVV